MKMTPLGGWFLLSPGRAIGYRIVEQAQADGLLICLGWLGMRGAAGPPRSGQAQESKLMSRGQQSGSPGTCEQVRVEGMETYGGYRLLPVRK